MKTALSIQQFTTEINRQQNAKRDFVAPLENIQFSALGGNVRILGLDKDENAPAFGVTEHAHNQLGVYMGMNSKYYDKCLINAPSLLTTNLNHWFQDAGQKKMLFRTLDGQVRGFLSDRYQRIDNFDLVQSLFPVFKEFPSLRFESAYLSPDKMYMKIFFPSTTREVKVGDSIMAGITIRNSETGMGSVDVKPMSLRLICLNGAVHDEYSTKRVHRGKRLENNSETYELFTDETLRLSDQAFILQVRDIVRGTMQGVWLDKVVNQMKLAAGIKFDDPKAQVEEVTRKFGLFDDEQELVLSSFFNEADMSAYGLFNAVTFTAQNKDISYERASELEEIGGEVLKSLVSSRYSLA